MRGDDRGNPRESEIKKSDSLEYRKGFIHC